MNEIAHLSIDDLSKLRLSFSDRLLVFHDQEDAVSMLRRLPVDSKLIRYGNGDIEFFGMQVEVDAQFSPEKGTCREYRGEFAKAVRQVIQQRISNRIAQNVAVSEDPAT